MSERSRIAFFTGQSDPGRCALSPQQYDFLERLSAVLLDDSRANKHSNKDLHDMESTELLNIECVKQNFPWHSNSAPWRATPLWRASLANGHQYLAARRGRLLQLSRAEIDAAHDWLQSAPRTLLLVGSCGLTLLNTLLAHSTDRAWLATRLRIVAYGGIAPRWPSGIDGIQLRGRRDWIAALTAPRDGPAPLSLDCGHLDYLARIELQHAVLQSSDWLHGGTR